MRRVFAIVIGLAAALAAAAPAEVTAQGKVILTLASLAPEGSVWDTELKQVASDWRRLSNASVDLRIAPGGRSGSECDVVPQLRAGTRPEAAALTAGLSCVDPAFSVFAVPFFYDSIDEVFAVARDLEPTLAARLEKQGLTLIAWGFGGWIHIFSSTEITSLAQLKSAKLYTGAGDSASENWYRKNGFTPVVVSQNDIALSLTNGAITAMPAPPYAALVFQWFKSTPFMLDLQVAPLVGALVVNTKHWNRIPADLRPKLVESARAMENRLKTRIPTQDREAVKEMQARSLKVVAPAAGFRQSADPLVQSLRGAWVPDDVYDLALKARAAHRQARTP